MSQNFLVHCAIVYLFTNLALHEDIPPSAAASFPAVTGPTLNTGQVPQDQQLNERSADWKYKLSAKQYSFLRICTTYKSKSYS